MAEIPVLSFNKVWTSRADFPSVQSNEDTARADMQCLFDEIKTFINDKLNPAIKSGDITDLQMTEEGKLQYTKADGTTETKDFGTKFVTGIRVDDDYHLKVTLSDGTEVDAGSVGKDVDLSGYVKTSQLSDALDSASSVTAATSWAVKQAYDLAEDAADGVLGCLKTSDRSDVYPPAQNRNKVPSSYSVYQVYSLADEAKTAASNAQNTANAAHALAQSNGSAGASFTSDTLDVKLAVTGYSSGGEMFDGEIPVQVTTNKSAWYKFGRVVLLYIKFSHSLGASEQPVKHFPLTISGYPAGAGNTARGDSTTMGGLGGQWILYNSGSGRFGLFQPIDFGSGQKTVYTNLSEQMTFPAGSVIDFEGTIMYFSKE